MAQSMFSCWFNKKKTPDVPIQEPDDVVHTLEPTVIIPSFDDVKQMFETLHETKQKIAKMKRETVKTFGEYIISRMVQLKFLRCFDIKWGGFVQKYAYPKSFNCHFHYSDEEEENILHLTNRNGNFGDHGDYKRHLRIKIGDKMYDYELTPIKYDDDIMNEVVIYIKHNWIYQPIRRDQNKSVELQSDELRKLINKECKFVPHKEYTQVHNGTNSFVIETTFLNELLLHQQHHMQTAEVILDDVIKS